MVYNSPAIEKLPKSPHFPSHILFFIQRIDIVITTLTPSHSQLHFPWFPSFFFFSFLSLVLCYSEFLVYGCSIRPSPMACVAFPLSSFLLLHMSLFRDVLFTHLPWRVFSPHLCFLLQRNFRYFLLLFPQFMILKIFMGLCILVINFDFDLYKF